MILRCFVLGLFCVVFAKSADPIHPGHLVPSPLDQFRAWLKLPEAEREKALESWPEDKRNILREKLRLYSSLPAAQRERRLDMLDLRWYLRPLMRMTPEERAAHLQNVPPPVQPMVIDRLRAWDQLDGATRAKLLENEETQELVLMYFAQIRRGVTQEQIFSALDEARRARLRRALETWSRTPAAERQRRGLQLSSFFELPPSEQSKTLSALSPAEQAEIQRTLELFAKLPAEQRRACVNSFQKFASMTNEERLVFLRNAARWSAMTPQERNTWKRLVEHLPPMPPEPRQLPPLPSPGAGRNTVATN